MRHHGVMGLLLLFSFFPAHAGEIEGSLILPDEMKKDRIAVWLEGEGATGEIPKETPTISQQGAKFAPDFIVISAGQAIEMPNDDDIAHNVFSYSETKPFNLGIYPKGQTKIVSFNTPGIVEMYCSIHRQMSATVFVAPSPLRTQSDENGLFGFADIPPGTYALKVWSKKLDVQTYPVRVSARRPTRVEIEPSIAAE